MADFSPEIDQNLPGLEVVDFTGIVYHSQKCEEGNFSDSLAVVRVLPNPTFCGFGFDLLPCVNLEQSAGFFLTNLIVRKRA